MLLVLLDGLLTYCLRKFLRKIWVQMLLLVPGSFVCVVVAGVVSGIVSGDMGAAGLWMLTVIFPNILIVLVFFFIFFRKVGKIDNAQVKDYSRAEEGPKRTAQANSKDYSTDANWQMAQSEFQTRRHAQTWKDAMNVACGDESKAKSYYLTTRALHYSRTSQFFPNRISGERED